MVLSPIAKAGGPRRLITFNAAQDAELPKKVKPEMKILTPQEAQRFLSTAAKDPLGRKFKFALWTGTRPEEYLDFSGKTWI